LLERRSNGGGDNNKYKIIDIDGTEISTSDLLEKYFFNEKHHTSCSVVETKYYNNVIEESSTVGEQSEVTEVDGNTGQYSNGSENNFIDDFTDTVSSSNSCSSYKHAREQIEKFFVSDNGQEEEHTVEESIYRPLIGQQNYKPFFYYCMEDTDVEFLQLKSMEDHMRLKDPERHKAKLLELIQEEKTDAMKTRAGDQDKT
jgi:hypothetical protein